MPGTKRQPEYSISKEDHAAKRQRRSVAKQFGDFDYWPDETRLALLQHIANQPDRRDARDVIKFLELNSHIRNWILETPDLNERVLALRRNPGVKSRYVAICLDVVSGIAVEDALRQNDPLPKADEKLHATDVDDALKHATPEHLANLAGAFSERTGPAFKEALIGVAWAAAGDLERLSSANIDSLTTLAGAFTKIHLDRDVMTANEAVAMQVAVRGDALLPHANIEQIATLAGAFGGLDDSEFVDPTNFNDAMDKLASQVTARGDELDFLPKASDEQLTTMRDMFGGPEVQLAPRGTAFNWPAEPDYPGALAKVVKELKNRDEAERPPHDTQRRPQLDNRARDQSVER